MSQDKQKTDWKVVELDFRAGVKSLEQIGKENDISKGRISQVAKRDGWTRDLNQRIKAKADAKVNEAALNAELNKETNRLAERDVVDANAEVQYLVRMSHRKHLQRISRVKEKLMDHLESVVDNFGDLGEVVAMLRNPDQMGMDRANDRLKKSVDRSAVIDDLKKLAEVDEKVRKGEREAFGIDDGDQGMSPIDSILAKINAAAD